MSNSFNKPCAEECGTKRPVSGYFKEKNVDEVKAKLVLRNAPENSKAAELEKVIKQLQNNPNLKLQEFVNLVGPYTKDNGETLRSVMGDDLNVFKKLARKVYESSTEDISDVLINEQLQMQKFYQDRNNELTKKLLQYINEIFQMAPTFDFEQFYKNIGGYLDKIMPIPESNKLSEDLEILRHQQAYHRLQWLKTEYERLHVENIKLQEQLEMCKIEQQRQQLKSNQKLAQAENNRRELLEQEFLLKETLNNLTLAIEKNVVLNEGEYFTDMDEGKWKKVNDPTFNRPKKIVMRPSPDWLKDANEHLKSNLEDLEINPCMEMKQEGILDLDGNGKEDISCEVCTTFMEDEELGSKSCQKLNCCNFPDCCKHRSENCCGSSGSSCTATEFEASSCQSTYEM